MKILLIEDDPGIIEAVAVTLELRWPQANLLSTFFGKKGIELAQKELPDLIILDIGLPDTDGFEVLRQIRGFSDVPLVVLTVMSEEMNKIKGLELGADDYIVKPFSPGEFLARLKAVIRRRQMPETTGKVAEKPSIRGQVRIDFATQEVSVGDKPLKLSPREYDLLYLLVTNEGTVFSNEMLLEKLEMSSTEFLSVMIERLNKKLKSEPDNLTSILDDGGTGYKFVSP